MLFENFEKHKQNPMLYHAKKCTCCTCYLIAENENCTAILLPIPDIVKGSITVQDLVGNFISEEVIVAECKSAVCKGLPKKIISSNVFASLPETLVFVLNRYKQKLLIVIQC